MRQRQPVAMGRHTSSAVIMDVTAMGMTMFHGYLLYYNITDVYGNSCIAGESESLNSGEWDLKVAASALWIG
jgi:hypothetical protein